MRRFSFFLLLYLCCLGAALPPPARAATPTPTPTATAEPAVLILSPLPGAALQGLAAITGRTAVDGFVRAELTFGYAADPTGTWFLIADLTDPVAEGLLAEWDTTTLTDGDYTLRLLVYYQDGRQAEARVAGVRVRNYTPIETSTPAPTLTPPPTATLAPGAIPPPTATATATVTPIPPTPTPLPPNPAELTGRKVLTSAVWGAAGVLAFFLLLGLYAWIRQMLHKARA